MAAYCRVSTEQEEQENSFRNQVEYYTRYIETHPEYELVDIYADEGISGTNTKKREEFKRMIADCENHKIDLVVTKSISRFARNTQDCLENYRKLKGMGITIIFEKENISSADTTGELLLTILSSLAQDESRNISENTKWGIRSKFQKGIPHINTHKFMGYDKGENGMLVINEKEAEVVRRIYREFLEGYNCCLIASRLNAEAIPGVSGKPKWLPQTIEGMLKNEKYKGDSLLQKTYTSDFLTKRQVKNEGEITQYYVKDSHRGIIDKDTWEAVQEEFERLDRYKEKHGIKQIGYSNEIRPFANRVICSKCGRTYQRKRLVDGKGDTYWECVTRDDDFKACNNSNVKESTLYGVFILAWNTLVDRKNELQKKWEKSLQGDSPLRALRAKQVIEKVADGTIDEVDPALIQMVLCKIIVVDGVSFEVHFQDGTAFEVKFNERS